MLVEVCVSSMSSIKNAATAGADRIELCSALELGGLTPSAGFIRQSLDLNILPIHCLIRPRQGHFFYSSEEITLIEQNIKNANLLGCQGVVVGMHNNEFKLEIPLLKKWKSLAGSMFITFHRAFDVLINPEESLEQLIELGFDCVLTSGQNENAIDGINNLKSWNEKFGLQINIMPGGGIGIDNCKIFKAAGLSSIHLSGSKIINPIKIPKEVNKELSFLNQPLKGSDTNILRQVIQSFKFS